MPKSRKRIAWQLAAGVVFLAIAVGFALPARVQVVRDIEIDANQATVFALVNDFHQMEQWSPKSDDDPNARITISDPSRGVAASLSWDGQIAGQGVQTITESVPFDTVSTNTELGNGVQVTSMFKLEATDRSTRITWSVERDFGGNLAGRYFGLLLDDMIGSDLEEDLAQLRDFASTLPRADFSRLEVEHILVEAIDIAYLRTTSEPSTAEISEAMGDAYFRVLGFMDKHGLTDAGAPLSITRSFQGSVVVFDAAIPIHGLTNETDYNLTAVKIGQTHAGPVVRVKHVGPYRLLAETHDKIAAYIAAMGLMRDGDVWESYVRDPTRTEESELLTYVYYPIREQDRRGSEKRR